MIAGDLIEFLNKKVDEYHQPFFIESDPISIPHLFTKKQDIEIAGFFAATFAWGTRKSIINSCKKLFDLMNNEPYSFINDENNYHSEKLKPFMKFVHRTFNTSDLLAFFSFL